jgi:hypothetical protein
MGHYEIRFPRIGEGVFEAKISKILVKEGDPLKEDQVYMHAYSDKVDIAMPSTLSGIVQEVRVRAGDWVKVGDVLLVVASPVEPGQAKRREERGNVQAGILYLSTQDSEHLCTRKGLGRLKFEDYKGFVDEIVAIARDLRGLPLDKLDDPLLDELTDTLYLIASFVKQFEGFDPEKLGPAKLAEHTRISREVQEGQDRALRAFSDLLERARIQVGLLVEQPKRGWIRFGHDDRAYVFISYSHTDKKFADDLARRLDRARIQYFLDTESIAPGQKIDKSVYDALNHASHMIVLISPALTKSAWVPYEMGYAMAREIIVIPYLMHESMEAPGFIANYKYLRGQGAVSELIEALRNFRKIEMLSRDRQKIFTEWNSDLARERLKAAKTEVCQQAVNSYTFLSEAHSLLTDFVHQGGVLRCILVDPYGEAVQMATRRSIGADRRLGHVISELEHARQILNNISQQSVDQNSVQLRVVDHLPEPVMTIIDSDSPEGTMFVTLNGFEKRLGSRPSFVLQRKGDEKWFEFYKESFENLWAHDLCRPVDLTQSLTDRHRS